MLNLCFLSGRVLNKIDLKFIYDSERKSLDKKHTSIVIIEIELEDKQIIKLHAYDEMADFVYRYVEKNNMIWIIGKLTNNIVEICEINNIY